MSNWTSVTCPHELEDGDGCGATIDVEYSVVPGHVYGDDADGNRGVWIDAEVEEVYLPDACPTCGAVFTEAEQQVMYKEVDDGFAANQRGHQRYGRAWED